MAQLYAGLEELPKSYFSHVIIGAEICDDIEIDFRFEVAIHRMLLTEGITFGKVVAAIEEYLEENRG